MTWRQVPLLLCLVCWTVSGEAVDCTRTSVGVTPLSDGIGLYPSGSNEPPLDHATAGLMRAQDLRLRPANVLLAVGMSNTRMEFDAFLALEADASDRAGNLTLVNGAMGGQVAQRWANTRNLTPYEHADQMLAASGRVPADVGVLWVKLTDFQINGTLAQWHASFTKNLTAALTQLMAHYPNTSLIYLSSRIYGGYEPPSRSALNPEPIAFEGGPVIRDVLDDHLNATFLTTSWLAWGPYLWADGLTPRSDGLTWTCSDVVADGVHPSPSGMAKVAGLLSTFLRTDPIARVWFLAAP